MPTDQLIFSAYTRLAVAFFFNDFDRSQKRSHPKDAPTDGEGTPCTRVTARNLGAAVCRTSNKIILTTGLNYARGTNNNICPARIPAINIEGVPGSRPPFPPPSLPLPVDDPGTLEHTLFMVHLGEVHTRLCGAEGPRSYRGGTLRKGA